VEDVTASKEGGSRVESQRYRSARWPWARADFEPLAKWRALSVPGSFMFASLISFDTTSPLLCFAGVDEVLLTLSKLNGAQTFERLRENVTQGAHPMRFPMYRVLDTFAKKVPHVD
jgi:hypothetical protein